jgi:DNA-binding GntR family transcriptional regulator
VRSKFWSAPTIATAPRATATSEDEVTTGTSFNRLSLAEQVERALREEIIGNGLAPNQRIDIAHYAKRWSTSPTPIRDAIKSLEIAGFVTVSPRRGVNVAEMNEKTLREIYEVRIAIECTAVRLACAHVPQAKALEALELYQRAQKSSGKKRDALLSDIDVFVHDIALEYCDNSRFRRSICDLNDLIRWSRLTVIRNLPRAYETTLPEHIRICEALLARDGEHASQEMFVHLNNSLDRICKFIARNESDGAAAVERREREMSGGRNAH